MFRVEFFVDDKKLSDALRALMGIAVGAPSAMPVFNAVKTGNGLAAATDGTTTGRFAVELKKLKGKQINIYEAREAMKRAGLNPVSASYHLKQARDAGLLTKSGKGNKIIYKVT